MASRIPHKADEMEVGADALPDQSNEDVKAIVEYITRDVVEREERQLHNALTARLGATVGIFLEHLVFWSGKSSHCESGWFYKNRDEIQYTTGLDRRDQDFARKVLRGEREWKRRTIKLLYEHRPSRRKATHFRVDLIALADLLDVTLPDELLPDEDLGDFDLFDEEEITESPCRATQESNRDTSESPYRAAESPCKATETPYRAPESPDRAASASTTASPPSSSFSYSLHSSGENGLNGRPSPPQINKDLEPEEQDSSQPLEDKRHSQDGDTPDESTAATEQLSPAEMKDRRFIRAALNDPPPDLEEPLKRYRTGQIDLSTLADTMRRKPYLRGSNAYSSLRAEQLAAVLDEMREEVAA